MIPTLGRDATLWLCIRSLMAQTVRDVEIVVVDNSACHAVIETKPADIDVNILEMPGNAGFGGAVNAGFAASRAEYLATINDDAVASPEWLKTMIDVLEENPALGSCASSVRLAGTSSLDSAGMVIARDGTSQQRGHGDSPDLFQNTDEVLLPSGSAALYRRRMIEDTGGFDAGFFLYCEDTDLGLRAQWAGWKSAYVPGAIVEHRYSQSAGRASLLKAYLVERNRLRVIVKSFPLLELLAAPFATAVRYAWHVAAIISGQGKVSEFAKSNSGFSLLWLAVKAHFALVRAAPELLRQRAQIRRAARISNSEFRQLLRRHSIALKKVAAH